VVAGVEGGGAGGGGAAGGAAVVEVVVVVVLGGIVDVVVVIGSGSGSEWFDVRSNAVATDGPASERPPAAWLRPAIWKAATAQTATSRIGTSPMARPRRATAEGIGESS
jgi:hypothetical protein